MSQLVPEGKWVQLLHRAPKETQMLELIRTKRTDPRLLERMSTHYSQPKGFVGRNLCYAVLYNNEYYGHIVAGSATRFLPGRNEFLGLGLEDLNNIINNIFFNVNPVRQKYPERNFTTKILQCFVDRARQDWYAEYKDECLGFETLVEKPRTGDLYVKAGWKIVGETKGYTCKRIAGKGSEKWGGKRIWNTDKKKLRPKLVLCYKTSPITNI